MPNAIKFIQLIIPLSLFFGIADVTPKRLAEAQEYQAQLPVQKASEPG